MHNATLTRRQPLFVSRQIVAPRGNYVKRSHIGYQAGGNLRTLFGAAANISRCSFEHSLTVAHSHCGHHIGDISTGSNRIAAPNVIRTRQTHIAQNSRQSLHPRSCRIRFMRHLVH